jgi:hypothetical protein
VINQMMQADLSHKEYQTNCPVISGRLRTSSGVVRSYFLLSTLVERMPMSTYCDDHNLGSLQTCLSVKREHISRERITTWKLTSTVHSGSTGDGMVLNWTEAP